jgi:hypothetical protein
MADHQDMLRRCRCRRRDLPYARSSQKPASWDNRPRTGRKPSRPSQDVDQRQTVALARWQAQALGALAPQVRRRIRHATPNYQTARRRRQRASSEPAMPTSARATVGRRGVSRVRAQGQAVHQPLQVSLVVPRPDGPAQPRPTGDVAHDHPVLGQARAPHLSYQRSALRACGPETGSG